MAMDLSVLIPQFLGPTGALAYAVYHNWKTDKRADKERASWQVAMDQNVATVKELADAHKKTADLVTKELEHCQSNSTAVRKKLEDVLVEHGVLKGKMEILERNNR